MVCDMSSRVAEQKRDDLLSEATSLKNERVRAMLCIIYLPVGTWM
jgi:hypothetical protein